MMMIDLKVIFSILLIHWFADFVMQTKWQAENKSTNNKALLYHTLTYTFIWYCIGPFYVLMHLGTYHDWALTKFVLITFVLHTLTDYFTSRLNTYLHKKGDIHNLFVSIGFDQILHYVQLFLTYYFLTR